MELNKAMNVFGVRCIENTAEFKTQLRKQYKKMTAEYHPDIAGGQYNDKMIELSEAYRVIKSFLGKTECKVKEACIILTVVDLIDIYNGKCIKINGESIDRKYLSQHDNMIIESSAEISCNNYTSYVKGYNTFSLYGTLEIRHEIEVAEVSDPLHVRVKCYNNEREIKLCTKSLRYVVTLEHNIKIAITIDKKQVQI